MSKNKELTQALNVFNKTVKDLGKVNKALAKLKIVDSRLRRSKMLLDTVEKKLNDINKAAIEEKAATA